MSRYHDLATCLNCGRTFDNTDPAGCECHGSDAYDFINHVDGDHDATADSPVGLLFRCRRCGRWTDVDGYIRCGCEAES